MPPPLCRAQSPPPARPDHRHPTNGGHGFQQRVSEAACQGRTRSRGRISRQGAPRVMLDQLISGWAGEKALSAPQGPERGQRLRRGGDEGTQRHRGQSQEIPESGTGSGRRYECWGLTSGLQFRWISLYISVLAPLPPAAPAPDALSPAAAAPPPLSSSPPADGFLHLSNGRRATSRGFHPAGPENPPRSLRTTLCPQPARWQLPGHPRNTSTAHALLLNRCKTLL